jgi:hypothetical protein
MFRRILEAGMPVSSPSDLALWSVSIVAIFKIASLLVGFGFGYMGYRLFLAGLLAPAGDLKASIGNKNLRLSRTAPGTFFALFGAAVVAVTIFQGFEVELPRVARTVLNSLPANPPMVTDETATSN